VGLGLRLRLWLRFFVRLPPRPWSELNRVLVPLEFSARIRCFAKALAAALSLFSSSAASRALRRFLSFAKTWLAISICRVDTGRRGPYFGEGTSDTVPGGGCLYPNNANLIFPFCFNGVETVGVTVGVTGACRSYRLGNSLLPLVLFVGGWLWRLFVCEPWVVDEFPLDPCGDLRGTVSEVVF
jgi:hypothetical protein